MPSFKEMIAIRSKKVIEQVKRRELNINKEGFKHIDVNELGEYKLKLRDRNVPKNIHMILNKQ